MTDLHVYIPCKSIADHAPAAGFAALQVDPPWATDRSPERPSGGLLSRSRQFVALSGRDMHGNGMCLTAAALLRGEQLIEACGDLNGATSGS